MLLTRIYTGLILAFCLSANSAFADDLRSAAGKVIECRSIIDPLERLACLDQATEGLSISLDTETLEATTLPTTTPATPEEPKWAAAPTPKAEPEQQDASTDTVVAAGVAVEEKRPLWARINPLRSDRPKQANFIEVSVVRITRNNIGRHFFHTADDGVWRQIEAEELIPPGFLPATATITRSMLGSPSLRFADPDRRSYKVRRIE